MSRKEAVKSPKRTLITHIHNAISFHVVSVCVVGPECASERLEAGSETRPGSHASLLHLSALLHPLRSALEASHSLVRSCFGFSIIVH